MVPPINLYHARYVQSKTRFENLEPPMTDISVDGQIHESSVQRILKNDLHYHPCKIVIFQHLKPADYEKRLQFAQSFLVIFWEENKIDSL